MKKIALCSVLAVLGLLISVATAAPTDAPAPDAGIDAQSPSMATVVPEPCTAGLLSLGGVLIAVRQKRRKA